MLLSFDDASKRIKEGALLHIAGSEALLRKLPKGNWIGGSIEQFMVKEGGIVSNERLLVTEFPYGAFSFDSYGTDTIKNVANDAFDNGFTIVIIPFDCPLHKLYAEKAPGFENMFIKNVAGWISGVNLGVSGQTPIAVNGKTGEIHTDRAAALHIGVPDDKAVTIGVINIFSQDEESPVIEFPEEGFYVTKCLINGEETVFADYIAQNGIDIRRPLVGDYSGNGVNISFRAIENGVVQLYSPVFHGIKYRVAKPVSNYAQEFNSRLSEHISDLKTYTVFSCNCILNFLYGELEGKVIENFYGPITFGEIAYQLLNQTLMYVSVCELSE